MFHFIWLKPYLKREARNGITNYYVSYYNSFYSYSMYVLRKEKLLGLLLALICFIGSIGIIVSQPAITNLISDGFTNGSHYYSVTVEKDNSQSQHIFQNKNDKKNLLILLTQIPQFLKKQKLKGLRNGICF